MTHKEYLEAFKRECEAEIKLTEAKNKDYAGSENAFANFDLIEVLTRGRITSEMGLLVRMSDKLQRYANLLFQPAAVKEETRADTLRDLSVYAKIAKIKADSATVAKPRKDFLYNGDLVNVGPGFKFYCGQCDGEGPHTASHMTTFSGETVIVDTRGYSHSLRHCIPAK